MIPVVLTRPLGRSMSPQPCLFWYTETSVYTIQPSVCTDERNLQAYLDMQSTPPSADSWIPYDVGLSTPHIQGCCLST